MTNNKKNEWNNLEEKNGIKIGDKLYYAQILPQVGIYEVLELKIRTIAEKIDNTESYFVGIEKKDKHALLFHFSSLERNVFKDRTECLRLVLAEQERHKNDIISKETLYEEY